MPVNPAESHPAAGNGDALALGFYEEATGCLARTYPRGLATGNSAVLASGTVYQTMIIIAAGTPVANITFRTGTTAKTGGTHGWYAITDTNQAILAVTADQTDPATVWGVSNTPYTLPVTTSFVARYTGYYYLSVMVAQSAGTMPTFTIGPALQSGMAAMTGAPAYCGSSSATSQTTPPAVGSAMGTLTGTNSYNFYAWVS